LTLDNGETLTCTPDHRFMLRDGSYKAAAQLAANDTLMPLLQLETAGSEFSAQPVLNATMFDTALDYPTTSMVSIERIDMRMDVYDIEVPHTHNFALASGVFVHNSAKQARDRHFQAILPLRGKILNTERARLDKILDNNEIKALIAALGTGIAEDFDVSKLRYGRIIAMTDADVDGSHIRTLLLTFFFRHMQPLLQEGHLYIAQPPIFLLKSGKQHEYIYNEAGLTEQDLLAKALKRYENPDKVGVQRYKGLGEMNPEQLWETTMNPQNRTLLQVTIEDAAEADRVFDMLMGSSVPPRRRFIQTHARSVRNLDV
jgi:DNA gyrase subunit B